MRNLSNEERDDMRYASARIQDERVTADTENGHLERPSQDAEGGLQRTLDRQSQFTWDQDFLSRMSSRSEGYQGPDSAVTVTRTLSLNRKDWEKLLTKRQALQQLDSTWKLDRESFVATKIDLHVSKRNMSIMGLPVINPHHPFSLIWHMLLLVIDLTYTAFVVPIGVGFDISDTTWTWCAVVDFIAGLVFFVDVLLGFHMGYVVTFNFKRKIVMNGRLVAKFYVLRGTFWVDFLSMCAWITQVVLIALTAHGTDQRRLGSQLQIMRILRLTRLTRLVKGLFVQTGSGAPRLPGLQKLGSTLTYFVQLLFSMAVLINFIGCLWYWVAEREGLENTWVTAYGPWVDEYGDGNPIISASIVRQYISKPRLYLASVYWALTTVATVGYGDITPQTALEQGLAMGVFILGIIFFGVLVGSLSQLLQRASKDARKAQLYREKMEHVEVWLRTRNFPMRLKRRIRDYYAQVWVRQAEEADESELLEELPHALRTEALWSMSRKLLTELPVFADLPAPLQFLLASHVQPRRLPPGHDICHQGGFARSIWLLESGQVVPVLNDLEGEVHSEVYLINGAALLQEVTPAFAKNIRGYRTVTACGLWEWSVNKVLNICKHHPGLYEHLAAHLKAELLHRVLEEPESWPQAAYELLQQVPDTADPLHVDPSNPSLGPPVSYFPDGQQGSADTGAEARQSTAENAPTSETPEDLQPPSNMQSNLPGVSDRPPAGSDHGSQGLISFPDQPEATRPGPSAPDDAAIRRSLRHTVSFQPHRQQPHAGSYRPPKGSLDDRWPASLYQRSASLSYRGGCLGSAQMRVPVPAAGPRRVSRKSRRHEERDSDDEDVELKGLIAGMEAEDEDERNPDSVSVQDLARALNTIQDQLAELRALVKGG